METAEPRNNQLWFHIAQDAYSGLAAYAIILVLTFLRDLLRRTGYRAPRQVPLGFSLSISRFYAHFLIQYRHTPVFYYVELARLAANVTVCTFYVIGTYHQNVFGYVRAVNRTLSGLFLADILSQVAASESAIASVLTWHVFFDVFSFPSLILASGPTGYLNFSFLRSIGAYASYSRLERRTFVQTFSSKRLIAKLAFRCFTLFYILAAGIQLLELPGDLLTVEFRQKWFQYGEWNFFNAAYFVIVTLSTVGYGDFSPVTVQGRIYTLCMIIVGIVIFTTVIGELVEQSSRGRGSGWFAKHKDLRHVIVSGTPKLSDLVLFISEFYSDSRHANAEAKVVVLVEKPSWTDREWFQYIANNQFLQIRLTFLIGSVRNTIDLQRAKLYSADAVFLLTSPSTGEDPTQQDSRTIMNILAVRNARTDIPIFAQTLLHDSSLQTHTALVTQSSWSKGTFFRDTEMKKNASYPGLFQEVLRIEFDDIPKAQKKYGRPIFERALKKYVQEHEERKVYEREMGIVPDLQRSRLVCLQQTHMALIAANIKVNGVGTLLSNMYLDVVGAKLAYDDPAWLSEYHMGASCSLAFAVIPEHLDGATYCEVAADLFHLGLVLIATSESMHVELRPVLSTDTILRRSTLGMFLTYHSRKNVGAALYLVAMKRHNGDLKFPLMRREESQEFTSDSQSSSAVEMLRKAGTDSQAITLPNSVNGAGCVGEMGERSSRAVSAPSLSSMFSLEESPAPESDSSDVLGGRLLDSQDNILNLKCSGGYMPDKLSGHVIIAMENSAPLGNLPLFLQNLWRKDDRKTMLKARKEVVVVIHPGISDKFKALFSAHERKSLFFVEGSSSSTDSWRRAKLKTAKSVVTMADYTQPSHISDARTIFTLLTLDIHTGCDHDIFICSELMEEKSLEFLREPTHPRRRGAMLGEPIADQAFPSRLPVPDLSATSMELGPEPTKQLPDARTIKFVGAHSRGNGSPAFMSRRDQERVTPTLANGEAPVADVEIPTSIQLSTVKPNASRGALAGLEDAFKLPLKGVGSTSIKSGEMKYRAQQDLNMTESSKTGVIGVDPADKPGAARARRGSLFSRSRYASGELLLHSNAITLLAREYIEPGFSTCFANLLGAELSSPGLKIRLLRIPRSMFADNLAVTRGVKRFVRYDQIFRSLVRHGVTPLGIYRSGDAPARIPTKSRKKRGESIIRALIPYLNKDGEHQGNPAAGSTGGLFGSFVEIFADLAPWKIRETLGRDELHGVAGSGSSESSEDFSEDDSSDDDTDLIEEVSRHNRDHRGSAKQAMEGHRSGHESEADGNGKPGILQHGDSASQKDKDNNRFSQRGSDILSKLHVRSNNDDSYGFPCRTKFRERPVTHNLLPYVYTLPEPYTLCAETDGIYCLSHPGFDLSAKWEETKDESF